MTFAPSRRTVLRGAAASLACACPVAMPAISRAASRPVFTHGVQSGDVDAGSGMIWARADRPSRMMVEIATTESFKDARALAPLDALPVSDLAVKRLVDGLPAEQDIFYRLTLQDLSDVNAVSEPVVGRFRTAPAGRRSVRFGWSGDTCGQGWGIDETGMTTYATILQHRPDFFIHSGDTIYADGPIAAEAKIATGGVWKNMVAEGVGKVAETLDEFRGRYKYNMLDRHVRALNAEVPVFYQWDDHEVVNNWSSSKDLAADARYAEKSIAMLGARASRAFHEMLPVRPAAAEPSRIYRVIPYGPMLDVFFLDLRSYRGPNNDGLSAAMTPDSRVLGAEQLRWLKQALLASRATWKVIACDMPIGLVVWDNWSAKSGVEAVAQGDNGPARGRELEFADLLRFIKSANIANVVWLTADVHYTAAHLYSPDKAAFQDFEPFWEFVSGPLHAGTFGPNDLDMTFGPEIRYIKAPSADQGQNLPPSAGMQFFGLVDIDGGTEVMTVRLMDRDNNTLFAQVLDPVRA